MSDEYQVSPAAPPRGRSVKQAAERIGISPAMTYREVSEGRLGSIRIGKRVIVPDHCIDAYLLKAG